MKQLFISLLVIIFCHTTMAQNVAINTDGAAPDASAALDVKSTDKGMLVPRMTTDQRNAIANPATGLLVFDNITGSFWFYTGAAWTQLTGGGGGSVWNTAGTHIYNSNSGNVGIGITNPTNKLHIGSTNPAIGFFDAGKNHSSGSISGDSTDLYVNAYVVPAVGSPNAGNLILQTGPGRGASSSGNVGIGKSDPLEKLSLNGNLGMYNGSDVIGRLTNLNNDFIINAKTGRQIGFPTPAENLILQYINAGTLGFTSGKVGIGTDAPIGKLHVSGSGELFRAGTSLTGIALTNNILQFYDGGDSKFFMISSENDLLLSNGFSNPSGNLKLFGNQVTIGATNPATGYKLSIEGKVICEELRVQVKNNWPDYVFDDSYSLKTLAELRRFISVNKHLPGIPTATEIEINGLELGQMQKMQMQKIEELTLYLLQLDEQLQHLKKENERLKQK